MRPHLSLAIAIAAEVTGTAALKLTDGFTNPLPSLVVLLGYGGSFYQIIGENAPSSRSEAKPSE